MAIVKVNEAGGSPDLVRLNDNSSAGQVYVGNDTANPLPFGSTAKPVAPAVHRNAITAADGTTKPAANNGLWVANPANYTKCRVFVSSTGSPTSATFRPYVRSGGTTGQVGTASSQALNGTPNYDLMFDVRVDGDDLLIYLEAFSGGTTPAFTVNISWR